MASVRFDPALDAQLKRVARITGKTVSRVIQEAVEEHCQSILQSETLDTALADVIAARKEDVLIVASSDMNHYESDAVTRVKDHRAIERILSLDPRGLYDVVTQQDISMCGFGPAVAMLMAATRLGAKSAELVKYATSGDVSGDRDMVVGYAGIVVR